MAGGGGGDCGKGLVARTKGGRETQVGGEAARRRGGRRADAEAGGSQAEEAAAAPPTPVAVTPAPPGTPAFRWGTPPKPDPRRPRSRLCAATPGGGGGQDWQGRAEGARERAARPRPPSGRPLPSPSGALFVPAPGPGPEGAAGPGGAGAGGARYLRVFVEQRQALLGHFETLGQPLAQPLHRLVGGHRQLVAGARRAVDGQAHGRRLGRRAQLAGTAGGTAPAAPGAAGLRLHPRPALGGWSPRGAANSCRASGQGGGAPQTGVLGAPEGGGQRAFPSRRSQERKANQESKIRVALRSRVGSSGHLPGWGLHSQLLSRAAGAGKGPGGGGATQPAALRAVCRSGRASPRVPSLSNSRRRRRRRRIWG